MRLPEPPILDPVPLTPNISVYIRNLDDFDLTEEQAAELLGTLWDVMCRFVDMGFDVSPMNKKLSPLENEPLMTNCGRVTDIPKIESHFNLAANRVQVE